MGVRVWCALVVLAIAGIGAPAVWAGEATSGPVHVVKPEGPPVDLATLVALNRMEEAERRLELVRTRAEKGLASPEDVKEVERRYDEAMAALDEVTRKGGAGPKVTVEVKDATLGEALELIFKGTDQSVVVQPAVAGIRPVNLSLKNVPLEDAVKAVTELNGLDYKRIGSVWVVSQNPQMVTVGGVKLPLVGALPEGPGGFVFERHSGGGGGPGALAWERRVVGPTSPPAKTEFPGSETLVDLDVKDAPLSEVVTKLSASVNAALTHEAQRLVGFVQAAEHVEIIAHDSLKSMRVTAKVYRWPAGQVLSMLADQTGTVCSEEREESPTLAQIAKQVGASGGVVKLARTTRIYLVPRPVLEVTGPGVPGRGGVGGGGGGGPVSGLGGGGASE